MAVVSAYAAEVAWMPAREADEATLIATLGENYRELGDLLEWGIIIKSAPKPIVALGYIVMAKREGYPPLRFLPEHSTSGPLFGYQGLALQAPFMLLGTTAVEPVYNVAEVRGSWPELLAAARPMDSPVLDFVLFLDGTTWGEDKFGRLKEMQGQAAVVRQLATEFLATPLERREEFLHENRQSASRFRSVAASYILIGQETQEQEAKARQLLQQAKNPWMEKAK